MPPPLCDVDVAQLASASSGATGADLKAIIEDGKLLFAGAPRGGAALRICSAVMPRVSGDWRITRYPEPISRLIQLNAAPQKVLAQRTNPGYR